jgi:hypothetical protein
MQVRTSLARALWSTVSLKQDHDHVDHRRMTDQEVDLDALLEELGIDPHPPPQLYWEALKRRISDVERHYALYRCSMSPTEALAQACRAVFTEAEYLSFKEFIDSGENGPLVMELVMAQLDRIIDVCEKFYDLIYDVQPRELASRESLDLVDLSEVWAADLRAWVAPAGEPGDYWLKFAATSIVNKAMSSARTRTGKKVKLDQAVFVIKRVQSKHRQANDMEGFISCAALIDRIQAAKV